MRPPLAIRAIGFKAHAALACSGGVLETVAEFDDAPYRRAGDEIIWVGNGDVAMHPRAVVLHDAAWPLAGARLEAGALTPWRPPQWSPSFAAAATMRAGCARLHRDVLRIGAPKGFAVMLTGRPPDFPFARTASRLHNLAQAFHDAKVDAVYAAALPLLGLGPGLTPAGDDYVGAALFSRQAIAAAPADGKAWRDLAMRLIDAAEPRTHAIGAALFRDLATGQSFAPLHRLTASLAEAASHNEALAAARALVAIGHSSGWEMLAGFIIGITGTLTPHQEPMKANQ